jgi:hypothetical protein
MRLTKYILEIFGYNQFRILFTVGIFYSSS